VNRRGPGNPRGVPRWIGRGPGNPKGVPRPDGLRTQAAMLLVVGATALWLGLSDASLAYVRAALRPPLVASGAVLLLLVVATLRGRPRPVPAPDDGHGHGGRLGAGWLLILPVLLLLVAPPALGSYAASRQAPVAGGGVGAFPPLPDPVDGAVPLPVSEFVSRALYDQHRSLAGVRVRVLGFVTPADGGDYRLTRFNFFCCAADAEAYEITVRGDPTPRRADQWLLVEGRWLPEPPVSGEAPSSRRPVLVADAVTPVRPPADRYEHNLYGI
jgi:uncharacterized repeat protein (TIGR03943 family)